jgi:hypothetical protein
MTPQEKAKELVDKFTVVGLQQRNEGIQCALIAVDEVLQACHWEQTGFWMSVQHEIEKL